MLFIVSGIWVILLWGLSFVSSVHMCMCKMLFAMSKVKSIKNERKKSTHTKKTLTSSSLLSTTPTCDSHRMASQSQSQSQIWSHKPLIQNDAFSVYNCAHDTNLYISQFFSSLIWNVYKNVWNILDTSTWFVDIGFV